MAGKSMDQLLGGVTRFGSLTVIREGVPHTYAQKKHRTALVRCECGTEKTIAIGGLRRGTTVSCGCRKSASAVKLGRSSRAHGESAPGSKSAEYRTWEAMKARCGNPNHVGYPRYGGRGISVCDRWSGSFSVFLADMGRKPTPKHSIDRIDVNGDYEPANCRWATAKEQSANKR